MAVGDTYRVIVIRETDANADDGVTETIVELAAPREMLAQFAPAAVAAALGADSVATVVDPVPETAPETGNYGVGQPKRRRRTKEQIAADEAAAKQGAEQIHAQMNAPTTEEMNAALASGGSVTRGNDGTVTIEPGPAPDKPYSPFG